MNIINKRINKVLNNILEIFFPTSCGICGKIEKNGICKKCELSIHKYKFNNSSIRQKKNLQRFHVFKYEGKIREIILQYKFFEKAYLYKTFSYLILNDKNICTYINEYDIIIPVPVYIKRKKEKGYNQTELIAKEIANTCSLEYKNNVLKKIKDTKKQSTLTKRERKENVKNVFVIENSEQIKNKKIILFDDIYTTGSTVYECYKHLKKAGASKVLILTIAKD